MNRSSDRILTTHTGSLIRTREIIEGMKSLTLHKPFDKATFESDIDSGVRSVVRKQIETGIDVPNDGEYARRGFTTYIHERLSGLEPIELSAGDENPLDRIGHQVELDEFPGFSEQYDDVYRFMWMLPEVDMTEMKHIRCVIRPIRTLISEFSYSISKSAFWRTLGQLKAP